MNEAIRRPRWLIAFAATAALALGATVALVDATPANAVVKEYEGIVKGKNRKAKTFRLDTGPRTVKIKVNRRTEFERIPRRFAGIHRGDGIEVDAKRTRRGLIALKVEPHNDRDGDDNGGGNDDGPNDD